MKLLKLPNKPECVYIQLPTGRVIRRTMQHAPQLYTYYVTGDATQWMRENGAGTPGAKESGGKPIWFTNIDLFSQPGH